MQASSLVYWPREDGDLHCRQSLFQGRSVSALDPAVAQPGRASESGEKPDGDAVDLCRWHGPLSLSGEQRIPECRLFKSGPRDQTPLVTCFDLLRIQGDPPSIGAIAAEQPHFRQVAPGRSSDHVRHTVKDRTSEAGVPLLGIGSTPQLRDRPQV